MKVCKVCGEEINTRDGENVMRDLGLTKVRGAMGGVYWE